MAEHESGPSSGSETPVPSNPGTPRVEDLRNTPPPVKVARQTPPPPASSVNTLPSTKQTGVAQSQSKYSQLLGVIEDMGRDIRPTYAGSKSSAERLKRGIVHARILVRECLMECERSARS